jgi:hypothetical protein
VSRRWLHYLVGVAVVAAGVALLVPRGGGSKQEAGASSAATTRPTAPKLAAAASTTQTRARKVVDTKAATTTSTTAPRNDTAAVAAMMQLFDQLDQQQYGQAWESLHPAQQALIPQQIYTTCTAKLAASATASNVSVVATHHEQVAVPGTKVTAEAVTITVKSNAQVVSGEQPATDTFHEFYVDGSWRWTVIDPTVYTRAC